MRRSIATLVAILGCTEVKSEPRRDHGPIAAGISAPLGQALPVASAQQLEVFERGKTVSLRRFDLEDGLGPAFNVTFCAACHERPITGGSAGLYRNFFLTGVRDADGAFLVGTSAGKSGGVIRMFGYRELPARPPVPAETNIVAQRNPIPFFGVGLLAELSEEEILSRADPDDEDGDGISGRPNFDKGFAGRFGRKAQTVSIEGFIRGPLFNHLGVTTDPLTDAQKAALPVSSVGEARLGLSVSGLRIAQAAAPAGPLTDMDDAPDPEMSTADLFDLVSFAMLLAAPEVEPLDEQRRRGLMTFDAIGCAACHAPRLVGPRGPLPVYSDLLLHDMGSALADGLEQGEAKGDEFRTQPLWGLAPSGPFLHDGRATTIEDAIRMHGGEASSSRDRFIALDPAAQVDLREFLVSLGGRNMLSEGLLPPNSPVPEPGEYGGPARALDAEQMSAFVEGRRLFDREFGLADGAGGPRLNGDSCRACHFDPVIGGAGPRGVNVMRHGIDNGAGEFTAPAVGTVLHKSTALFGVANRPQPGADIFEHRQTPTLLGLGLIESIPDAEILSRVDPDDRDGDGISGRESRVDGGRLGRFGWKAQVPTIAEFVRDAVTTELGMTLPLQPGLTFGRIHDNDDVPDPELGLDFALGLTAYLELLGAPPRKPGDVREGEQRFESVGCAACHVPVLAGAQGPVPLYSDLLLHDILPAGAMGIEEASAAAGEFRTPPLWGLSETSPYLHSGAADTIDQAIRMHDAEAASVRDAYVALDEAARAALLAFLDTL